VIGKSKGRIRRGHSLCRHPIAAQLLQVFSLISISQIVPEAIGRYQDHIRLLLLLDAVATAGNYMLGNINLGSHPAGKKQY
jgi:hypothetical protein